MKIVMLRHGSTEGNIRGAYIGRTDEHLCAAGERALREACRRDDYPPAVDAVYTSPLERCKQTARILYPQLEPQIVDAFRERDFGEFDGLTHREITSRPGYRDWGRSEENMEFPNGEDWEDFSRRCVNRFLSIVGGAGEQSVAIVTHGGVIMAVLGAVDVSRRSRYDWQCWPGGGYELKFDRSTDTMSVVKGIGI